MSHRANVITRRDISVGIAGTALATLGVATRANAADGPYVTHERVIGRPKIAVYSSVSSDSLPDYGAEAMKLHRRGVSAVYVDEDRDALIAAAAIIAHSSDVEVATGWCPPSRAPMTLALAAQWLATFSKGRFTLGVGINSPIITRIINFSWNERHAFLADYLRAMRYQFDAQPESALSYNGAYFRFSKPGTPYSKRSDSGPSIYPPLFVKVTDMEQFAIAGETCTGIALGQMTPIASYERVGRNLMQSAAMRAGRPAPTKIRKMIWGLVSLRSEDAVGRLKRLIVNSLMKKDFDNIALAIAAGFEEEVAEITSRMAAGGVAAAAEAVPEKMWRAYGLAGTREEVRAQAAWYAGKVDTLICLGSAFELENLTAYLREHHSLIDAVTPKN